MEFLFATDGLVCILSTIPGPGQIFGWGGVCFFVGLLLLVSLLGFLDIKNCVGVHCALPISRNGVKLFYGESFIST